MKTKEIGSLEERGTGTESCVLVSECLDEMCNCLAQGAVREEILLCKEEKMITSQQKRTKLSFGRPSQYPLPQGLLIAIHEE